MYRIENKNEGYHVWISGIITDEGGLSLADDIKNAVKSGIKNLTIHINSYGGSVKGAWDIVAAFKSSDMQVTSINEGFAVSAASIILAASDVAKAFDYSTAMIHDPLYGDKTLEDTEGNIKELLQRVKDGIMSVFTKRIKVPKNTLSKMLTKETSLNAIEQLELGLVDEVIEKNNKPIIDNSMEIVDIYNVIQSHNKKHKIMQEVINYLKLEKEASEQDILNIIKEKESTVEEVKNEVTKLSVEMDSLKVENFILKNSLSEKEEEIKNAVDSHGIAVLDTILNFISLDTLVTKPATELEDVKEDKTELKNELVDLVQEANTEITNVVVEKATETPEATLEIANKLFNINGDNDERVELKESNPTLYDKLLNIYTESL